MFLRQPLRRRFGAKKCTASTAKYVRFKLLLTKTIRVREIFSKKKYFIFKPAYLQPLELPVTSFLRLE